MIRAGTLFLLFTFTLTGFARAAAGPSETVTALVGATVIDGTGRPPKSGQTILIRGERIVAVGDKIAIPKGATVLDVAGKTVLPGLVDMHGHMYARGTAEMRSQFDAYPLLFLAGGVTTVRSPGDFEPEGMIALRDRINAGETIGPRIFSAGPYFDHDPSQIRWFRPKKTVEESLQLFNEWKGRLDWVKFYTSITEPQLRAVLEAAHRAGIPATGHLDSIPATRAIELGIDGLEHGLFAMSELSGGRREAGNNAVCKLAALDLNSPVVTNLVRLIVSRRVVIDPTIVVLELSLPDLEPVTPDWEMYLSEEARAYQARIRINSKPNAEAAACLRAALQKQKQFIKMLHAKGGVIVAGTDPVSPRLIPGYALHRELRHFVDAGLTPVAAIKAATLDAARALRREKEFGTIAPGKLADLVVVGGNPATRIEDVGRTEIVFKAGARYDPAALRTAAVGLIR